MAVTVEQLCNQLAKHKLLPAERIRELRKRWQKKGGSERGTEFGRWLVEHKQLTSFQLELLLKGHAASLRCGSFLLIDRIGQGRMAGVYLGKDASGRLSAVKVLPPTRAEVPAVVARFLREARLAEKLSHPNIVRAYEHGKNGRGLHYIAMEFVEGESLDEVIKKRGPFTLAEAVAIIGQVLDGLQYLFEEGAIHRDLKPANIMLVGYRPKKSLQECRVKILDVGLGRMMFDESSPLEEALDLTQEGTLLGTPMYMAPEQAKDARLADIRADIYSAGCIFFEMLAGRPPFTDKNVMRVLMRHANEAPPRLRSLVRDLPEEIDPVMEGFLAKDPAERFATPQQAARAVRNLLEGPKTPGTFAEVSLPVPVEEPVIPHSPAPELAETNPFDFSEAATAEIPQESQPEFQLGQSLSSLPTEKPAQRHSRLAWPQLSKRDLIFAALGAAGVLLIELLLWLLLSLLT